jgi:hypothetical protein
MLYCQLAEAGGVYETLKNMMGIVTLKPYLLWPFKDLVKVRKKPDLIIGPNANSTFRDLATTAKEIGLSGLSALLESTFRDDIRNGIYHADYVIWNDGLRLRNRNGGYANKIPFDEVSTSVSRAIGFFHILREYNLLSVYSFNPPKTISGRFSANFPMPWTVGFDPESGAFSISGSSPAPVVTPEYKRQEAINGQLGGRVLSVYSRPGSSLDELEMHINRTGFEPNIIEMNDEQFEELPKQVDNLKLWDDRQINSKIATLLVASPWGFRNIHDTLDFDRILPNPLINLTFGDSDRSDS